MNGGRVMIIDDTPRDSPVAAHLDDLNHFRAGVYGCLTRRSDTLFELADAVIEASLPVTDLARLSLASGHRRGHGGMYDAINSGGIDTDGLGDLLAAQSLPMIASRDGRERIVLAIDVSNWLRPDAATSPGRAFCHTYARGAGQAQMIPGWPYSFVAALEPGATSWTALLDVTRLHPDDDATATTAAQLASVVERLQRAGHHRPGDPHIAIVADAGYDTPRLAWLLADLPVVLIGRMRSNRVFHAPAGARQGPTKGRGPRHGAKIVFGDTSTHPAASLSTTTATEHYGTANAKAWGHMHPKLERRGAWASHDGPPPIIEGTIIQLTVEHLPGNRHPDPVWLWVSDPDPDDGATIDHWWSLYLRRFDLEHTFRFCKHTLGWTQVKLRDPDAADRWTWLIIAAHTMLRLARGLVADHRLPWQKPLEPHELTPARVRAGYYRIHQNLICPASAPKRTRAGPGRPKGRKNTHPAPIQPVGKAA